MAAMQDQWRLLEVQEHDTRLAQIAHRRRTLPEHARLETLAGQARSAQDELVAARTVEQDLGRELAKAEADVELVRTRAARDRARLDAGQGSPKDLQAMQHEIASLAQRQSVLEDAELEVMERVESGQNRVSAAQAAVDALQATSADVTANRDAAVAELDAEAAAQTAARAASAAGVPAELLALYERLRQHSGGVGAAKLMQRRCGGCRIELNSVELGQARVAADTEVLRHEECGCILVRTAESGL
jgi:uncharacterized protein